MKAYQSQDQVLALPCLEPFSVRKFQAHVTLLSFRASDRRSGGTPGQEGRGHQVTGLKGGGACVGVPRKRETRWRASYGGPGVCGVGGWVRERERGGREEREGERDKRLDSRVALHNQQRHQAMLGNVMKERGRSNRLGVSDSGLRPSPRPASQAEDSVLGVVLHIFGRPPPAVDDVFDDGAVHRAPTPPVGGGGRDPSKRGLARRQRGGGAPPVSTSASCQARQAGTWRQVAARRQLPAREEARP